MQDFASIHVTGDDWIRLCEHAIAEIGTRSTGELAFLYLSDDLSAQADRIVDYLREHSGIGHWVGCSGMGLCGIGRETYDETALSLLLTPYAEHQFRVFPGTGETPDDWLATTREWREQTLASVAVVHGDPSNQELPTLLTGLSADLQNGFLIGGIASAHQLAVQLADHATGGGLSGVLFSGEVSVSTSLSQGCSLIGSRHTITACQGNIIATIDGRPALDVFKEDIGEVLARDLQRVGGYIFAALPIPGSDTGDYLVRNLIGIDPDQGLLAIGDRVSPDSEIQFARRDAQTARNDLSKTIELLKERLPSPARGALYHSCLGRGRHLFGDDSAELQLVRAHLGEVPLAGFYANGEISHNRLYGFTGVLTLFS